MRILFDPTFDATPWPGPLAARHASAGEAWAGPRFLLSLLETQLGLAGPPVPAGLRAASLVPELRAREGFWSASAEVDPLGTARMLLEWRDALRMAGWRGEVLRAGRLAALAGVTSGALAGVPDRIAAVADVLARRAGDVEELVLLEPTDDLPPLWRTVVDGLAARGTRVATAVLAPADAAGDLGRAQLLSFRPEADGTLQLLRPHGPLQAAEEVAAWLAARSSLDDTVVIQPDPVLDAALHRHGLPTTGSTRHARDNALMQILPLALALGWAPPDPERALELLTLAEGPVPRAIAWRLARALHEQPAVDSDPWRNALRDGLATVASADDRSRIETRLHALFDARVPRGGKYPAAEVRRRLDVLDGWARGRMARAAADRRPGWTALLRAGLALRDMLDASALERLEAPELERFVEEALDGDVPLPAFPAEAGIAAVRAPGAVAGPAARVVWWGFDLDSVPSTAAVPLTGAERRALAEAGVALPDPGELAVAAATRWRRPLQQATEALVLLCPRTTADGEERHPHPLWDELEAELASGASLAALVRSTPLAAPPPVRHAVRPLPEPRSGWRVATGALRGRAAESPSSLGTMLGCSFKWAVSYQGGVWAGETAALPATERLLGTLTHVLLARMLGEGVTSPPTAQARAEALFDAEGARIAAPLFLPGFDAARADARAILGFAARELTRLLTASKLGVRAVETAVERETGAGRLAGTPDLVVGPPTAVIDLKWSGARYRREQLAAGTAHQLAAYAHLVADDGASSLPPVGYFIVRDQRLLTTDGAVFRDADRVEGPPIAVTWDAFVEAEGRVRAALADGVLTAPLADPADKETPAAIVDGVLTLPPPCRYCDLQTLCGRVFGAS
ncbi:MAG: PD-(D/E)XK nuclease family protein [Deltaproteobacteria bacterium]|nr:PD-(D/E)XK nuclease family protein [Deltaproteobacteria bacterium]